MALEYVILMCIDLYICFQYGPNGRIAQSRAEMEHSEEKNIAARLDVGSCNLKPCDGTYNIYYSKFAKDHYFGLHYISRHWYHAKTKHG